MEKAFEESLGWELTLNEARKMIKEEFGPEDDTLFCLNHVMKTLQRAAKVRLERARAKTWTGDVG